MIELARERAVESLRRCCGPWGLAASGRAAGHHQVWARDAMIALLGARFAPDDRIQAALRGSIATLAAARAGSGQIPNNVDCKTGAPNFRAYADAGLWWIVGSSLLAPDPDLAASVLSWYDCQDVDQSGLLSMQEAADWQDLFCTRGKGLYLNCLYVLALRAAGLPERAARVAERINHYFWYRGDGEMFRHVSHSFSTTATGPVDSLGRKRWIPGKRNLAAEEHYLPYLSFREAGEWFDTLGNLLAILAGVADERQTGLILDMVARHRLDAWPARCLTPVIRPGDPDWRPYYGAVNAPFCYHNGGIWPFIGGFYVAALVKAGRFDTASAALDRLAELCLRGEFNEWHHGESTEPMGVRDQAWSAGMLLFAAECVRGGRVAL
jgi:hypothetical protein